MKAGIIGFGRAGKAVASAILYNKEICLEWVLRKKTLLEHRSVPEFLGYQSDEPGLIYSSQKIKIDELLDKHPVDLIVDFSNDQTIYEYGAEAERRGITIISAISHYHKDEITYLYQLAKKTKVFWSPNITLGVNFLLIASKFLKKITPFADIVVLEEHFKEKSGVSGTALKIAESLDVNISDINSIRAGGIVGKHEIIFGFPYQTVRLTHESISREALGNGVIFAAQNLKDKSPGFYNFESIMEPYFSLAT